MPFIGGFSNPLEIPTVCRSRSVPAPMKRMDSSVISTLFPASYCLRAVGIAAGAKNASLKFLNSSSKAIVVVAGNAITLPFRGGNERPSVVHDGNAISPSLRGTAPNSNVVGENRPGGVTSKTGNSPYLGSLGVSGSNEMEYNPSSIDKGTTRHVGKPESGEDDWSAENRKKGV